MSILEIVIIIFIYCHNLDLDFVGRLMKLDWIGEQEYLWINGDYAMTYSHLLPHRHHQKWISNRQDDVTIARWRSRTVLTCNRLFRMKLIFSPLCQYCYDHDSPEHTLLFCPRLLQQRSTLLNQLRLPQSISFNDLLSVATSSRHALHQFLKFSKIALQ